jgi:hypothetical protein
VPTVHPPSETVEDGGGAAETHPGRPRYGRAVIQLTARFPGDAADPRHTERTLPVFRLLPAAAGQGNG